MIPETVSGSVSQLITTVRLQLLLPHTGTSSTRPVQRSFSTDAFSQSMFHTTESGRLSDFWIETVCVQSTRLRIFTLSIVDLLLVRLLATFSSATDS